VAEMVRTNEDGLFITQRFSVGAAIWSGMEKRCRLYLRLTNDSWRVDETCIEVKGKKYLYRAVDSAGQTLGFGLAVKRDTAANAFSAKPSKLFTLNSG